MARPQKWRHVEFIPDITYFKPAGVPLRNLDEIILNVEELEALRLKDIEQLEQEQCAERMNISRPTFFRIINSARSKVAEALINGKAIKIEGGKYRFVQPLRCKDCGFEWRQARKNEDDADDKQDSFEDKEDKYDAPECPRCHSKRWARKNRKGNCCKNYSIQPEE